jgi:hypothetical protein
MAQFQTIKAVFNGGEMSPIMDGRTDSEKYATGCKLLENFMVRSYGGAFKRPGTRFGAANSDVTGCVRLIPFRRSVDSGYVLGFKTNAIKVWSYSAGVFTLKATLTTTYTEAEIADLHFVQLNDVMYLTVATEHPKIITRVTDTSWTFTDVPFQFAPALDPPSDGVTMRLLYDADDWSAAATYTKGNIRMLPYTKAVTGAVIVSSKIRITSTAHGLTTGNTVTVYGVGGATNANITSVVTVIDANTFQLDSSGATLPATYTAGTGAWYITTSQTYIRTFVYNSGTTSTAGVLLNASWTELTYKSSWNVSQAYIIGNVTEYFGSNYVCVTAHTSASDGSDRPGVGTQWVLITVTDYRLIASAATFDANEVGSTWLLSPGSTGRIASETIPAASTTLIVTTTSAAVFIQGSYIARTNWTSGNNAPQKTTFQLQESLDRINFTTIREWYINETEEGTISYPVDAPNTGGWYRWVAIRSAVSGGAGATGSMTIEPVEGKVNIPFKIESYVSTTQVRGIPRLAVDSLIPNEVVGFEFPVWAKGALSVTRGYPRTCGFHDSRLWFASTSTEPTRIWGSQTDDFYTFLTGSLDTSGIDVTLAATQANAIEWISSFKRTLVIGTSGEEWTMDSGDQDGPLTPSSLRLRRWSRYGSSKFQPVLSGDGLLWLTRDNRLREFAYVFERDGYSAPEMTLLAEHVICRSNVIQMFYSQSPDPVVWLVHEDGTWSGFTYDRENNVTAWHRHRSRLACKSMCSLYSSSSAADSLMFLMNYNALSLESIDGEDMRNAMTSSNLSSDVRCMDSWMSHSSVTVSGGNTTFSNLTAANPQFAASSGNLVAIIGGAFSKPDGSQHIAEITGGSGTVVFTGLDVNLANTQYIGFHFTAYLVPNRFEIQLRDGTAQMRKWRVTRASFRIFRSYFGYVWNKITDADFTNYTRIVRETDEYPIAPDEPVQGYPHRTGQTFPQTVNFDWNQSCEIAIASRHSVPFNVLGMILEIEVEGTSGAGA